MANHLSSDTPKTCTVDEPLKATARFSPGGSEAFMVSAEAERASCLFLDRDDLVRCWAASRSSSTYTFI